MKVQICIFLFALILSLGCKKSTTVDVLLDGNYTGVLVITNSVRSVPITRPISISLQDGKFNITLSADANLKPSGGKGTYNFKNGVGYFTDEGIRTADFDWNMILNGEYDIRSSGVDLTLRKRFTAKTDFSPATSYATVDYEYILKRSS
ncbi:hypothetical protein J7E50_20640 [Pedobacter sp. ISL-68]|uniref:hypothetical protein n=1 Tax=unclassified Pedobacter TaxID=2628915 RepID=UPI001BE9E39F|nr:MULTISPECIES: hypothetical protein [unclassified Pedobacter]MBT2563955.1 hypothetical protein [Pedobacter sp. ISL-64]MBT2592638.1 hypothetical protein [Pedobacter sp. ISL-68]